MPLEEHGVCNLRLDPVALQVRHARDETVVYGVADEGVELVTIRAGGDRLTAEPAADDAFIASLDRGVSGRLTVMARYADGTERSLEVGVLPDFDEITAVARRNAPKPGESPPHSHTP